MGALRLEALRVPHGAVFGRIDPMEMPRIDAALFARYDGPNPDRWQQLVGHAIVHIDGRWGEGTVEDVRWGSPCEHVAAYIQIRIRYAGHGVVTYCASSFDVHHRLVTVSADLERLLRTCYGVGTNEAIREALLERHDRALREAEDRRRIERARDLKRRAEGRKPSGASS
jgi:hypothetical protein